MLCMTAGAPQFKKNGASPVGDNARRLLVRFVRNGDAIAICRCTPNECSARSRADVCGLVTHYIYDPFGRVVLVRPPAWLRRLRQVRVMGAEVGLKY